LYLYLQEYTENEFKTENIQLAFSTFYQICIEKQKLEAE
jgi:hypothetical protein